MKAWKIGFVALTMALAGACGSDSSGDGEGGDTGSDVGATGSLPGATTGATTNTTGSQVGSTTGGTGSTTGGTGSTTGGGTGSTTGSTTGGTTGGTMTCTTGPTVDPASTKPGNGTGTITGNLSVGVAPGGGKPKKGDLYIAVLESFDLISQKAGPTVAQTLVRCADLTSGAYAYKIEGVPPRAAAYKLSAFLDVNGNATTGATPGPDGCDPLNIPSDVTVSKAETVNADLNLNLTIPTMTCK